MNSETQQAPLNANVNAMAQQQMKSEEIICIYHAPCQDGFTAAWSMRHLMPYANIRFIPAKYGDPAPDVRDRIVYILDFSYSREVTQHMLNVAKRLLILDHHESALKNLVGLDRDSGMAHMQQAGAALEYKEGMKFWISDKGSIVLDMSRSGAGMAWDYFSAIIKEPMREFGKKRPPLLSRVEDRDLWRFDYPETRYICAALFSYEYDFDIWDRLMMGGQDSLDMLRDEGEGILRKQTKDINELLHMGTREMVIAGHKVPVCNLPYTLASEGCHTLLIEYRDAPFAASYMDQAHGRVFSLRSEDSRVNVSEVAMKLGGGGHRNAAGFTMKHGWEGDDLITRGQHNSQRKFVPIETPFLRKVLGGDDAN